ncbi:MAG: glycosyltransferase family 4 protein [Chloroflexota bacterium]
MRQLAERFVERGHSVTVATSALAERTARSLNGVTIAEFGVSGSLARGLQGDVDAYREFVLRGEFDILMIKAAQQWTFDALWPVLGRIAPPKVFIPCGFSGLYDPAYSEYFREMPQVLRAFDQLVFYASDCRDINFARAAGLSNLIVLSNAASEREFGVLPDPGFRARHRIAEDAFVILTVGTFTGGLKGHRELAEAFDLATFPGRSATLILNGNVIPSTNGGQERRRGAIGAIRRVAREARRTWRRRRPLSSPDAQAIASRVARLNRGDSTKRAVILDLPRPELVQAYLHSDLFVFASNIEYSPLVLFEAAAAGLPFLTVPVGNAAEIAERTGGGMVCPAPRDSQGYTRVDPAVLAKHISSLAENPELLDTLGREGRRSWSAEYTWDIVSRRYETLFARLIEQKRSPNVEA